LELALVDVQIENKDGFIILIPSQGVPNLKSLTLKLVRTFISEAEPLLFKELFLSLVQLETFILSRPNFDYNTLTPLKDSLELIGCLKGLKTLKILHLAKEAGIKPLISCLKELAGLEVLELELLRRHLEGKCLKEYVASLPKLKVCKVFAVD